MRIASVYLLVATCTLAHAQDYILKADRVFDGLEVQKNWVVAVEGNKISYVGPDKKFSQGEEISLPGQTLLPGLIEAHGHLFLYPYNETAWNDQVLKESISYRTVRAAQHAETTVMAGFTTFRDLGTEGAGYADVGIKRAIEDGTLLGPRLLISTRAIVATGSYGPKGFADHVTVPKGAAEVDGMESIAREVRTQIGNGADFIKVYADYRYGPDNEARPTFSIEELKLMVSLAESSGRYVVAHASTPEGMRRAAIAGVESIEHGDGGTAATWEVMKEHNVALCPTLAAGDAILQYNGWDKQNDPAPDRIVGKKASFKQALEAGVPIMAGADVGVFAHGDNVRELELMHAYGMPAIEVLRSATSLNAKRLHLAMIGQLQENWFADIIAVAGDPTKEVSALRNVRLVILNGKIVVNR